MSFSVSCSSLNLNGECIGDISLWKDALDGFITSTANNIKDLINPQTIGLIGTIVGLTATGIPTAIAASIPAVILTIATCSVLTGINLLAVKSIIDEVNTTYKDKSNYWKITYAIGRLQPDLTLIKSSTGLLKNLKISDKVNKILALDNEAYIESVEFILNEQKLINRSSNLEEIRDIKREELDLFTDSLYDTLQKSQVEARRNINKVFKVFFLNF